MGMSSNGLLSVTSIVVALFLLVAARVGGNFASTANMVMVGLANVFFGLVVGLIMTTFGMYGRVNLYLPYDNPYYQARHPEAAEPREALPESSLAARSKLRIIPPKTTA